MLISNCVQNDDGTLDFSFHVSQEEAAYLMDFAIKELVHKGIIKVASDQAEQELELFTADGGILQ